MNSPSMLTIALPKREKERLHKLALSFGLSLPELSRRILEELASYFPAESFQEYKNPKALRASFLRALRDYKTGRIRTSL